ncbi:MAG: hypothetical protein NTV73_18605 [Hyphomicrobiales bacterium]|nr:hypothetical protein [Hyphomicrobiales bacterium]
MAWAWTKASVALLAVICVSACTTLIAPYDPTFDSSLNKLSEDTAKFLAAASAGGPERAYRSKETVAYYAATGNVLDRLIARAKLTRGYIACPTDASLESFAAAQTSKTELPDDFRKLDCREFQLYSVRLYSNQLEYAHASEGVLNRSEATALGGAFQTAIMGTIQTFVANKPTN